MMTDLNRRRTVIVEMLCHHDYLNVDELSSKFGVTSQTIRRDLQVLTEMGIARRGHGGVERLALPQNQTYLYSRMSAAIPVDRSEFWLIYSPLMD